MARGLGLKKVRELLGLAVWEVELAVETSLLRRLPDRTFDPVSVNAAKADAERFQRLLAAEHRCNATQAATRLGISPQRFKCLADRLTPVAVDEIRKYGRTLTIRYYRAADVDALADLARADTELRAAARTLSRSEAARKAAATRKLNRERAVAAHAWLQRAMPGHDGDPIQVLIWAAALMEASGTRPRPLRRLACLHDPRITELLATLRTARLSSPDLDAMLGSLLPLASEVVTLLTEPTDALGVPVDAFPADFPRLGDHLFAPALHELLSSPPTWFLHARADEELRRAAQAAASRAAADAARRHRAEQAAVDAANRAATRLSDASVAELFSLPVDVIRQLRPGSGRWSAQHVAGLLRNPPPWLRSESAARTEVERRRRKAQTRVERRAQRQLSWRRHWAEALGIPLERVPQSAGRPTPKAISAARDRPPPWVQPGRSANKETPAQDR